MKRNETLEKLKTSYLFPQIQQRKRQFLETHPKAKLISLGIGDTTEPISPSITKALIEISEKMGTEEEYRGYGPEQGIEPLRERIATVIYGGRVRPDEVFISDGAKCDIARLQVLFGGRMKVALQNPSYPVYVDGSLIQGVDEIYPMSCTIENGFFPHLEDVPAVDLIYFCSPNNPTGAVATHSQLEKLVAFAKKNHSLILFDSAYAAYIQDPNLPKSIYEIEGSQEVAIEISSFSKLAGFTGIRLGWTVVPEALRYENGESIRKDWNRITTTLFNGASILSQYGGLAALEEKGLFEIKNQIHYYLENAALLKTALERKGCLVFGAVHAPYLWVHFPGKKSWDVFQQFLEQAHLITTPGSGFGSEGEGFIRLTAYGKREALLQAIERLEKIKI